jgi:hypothetical protein
VELDLAAENVAGMDVTGRVVGLVPETPTVVVSCSAAVGLTRKAVDNAASIALESATWALLNDPASGSFWGVMLISMQVV